MVFPISALNSEDVHAALETFVETLSRR